MRGRPESQGKIDSFHTNMVGSQQQTWGAATCRRFSCPAKEKSVSRLTHVGEGNGKKTLRVGKTLSGRERESSPKES